MTKGYVWPHEQYRRLIAISGFAMLLAVVLLTASAHANVIATPVLGLSATGSILYSPDSNVFGGSGTGTLTTAAGSLAVGTPVDWYLMGGFYPDSATLLPSGYVMQDFIPMINIAITVASDGSNVLSGFAFTVSPGAYAYGLLGSSSALIVIPFSGMTSSYIVPPILGDVEVTGTTSVPLSLDPSCIVCPSISTFDLDWNLSVQNAATPEPASLLLIGGGLLSIAWRCRRRAGRAR